MTETDSNEIEIQDLSEIRDDAVRRAEDAVMHRFSDGGKLLKALDADSDLFVSYADTGMGLIASSAAAKGTERFAADENLLRRIDRRFLDMGTSEGRPYVSAVAGAIFADGGYQEYSTWFDDVLSVWIDELEGVPEEFWAMADAAEEMYAEHDDTPRESPLRRFKREIDRAMEPVGNFLKENLIKAGILLAKSVSQVDTEHVKIITSKKGKASVLMAVGVVMVPILVRNAMSGRYSRD